MLVSILNSSLSCPQLTFPRLLMGGGTTVQCMCNRKLVSEKAACPRQAYRGGVSNYD